MSQQMPHDPSEISADTSAMNVPQYRGSRRKVLLDLSFVPPDTLDAFQAVARKYEWQLIGLHYTAGNVPSGITPAGAIIRSLLPDDPHVQAMLGLGASVVRMGRLPHPLDNLIPTVFPDYAAAGRLAATHLAERGFTELGYVGYKENEVAKAIWKGFEARAVELECASHLLEFGDEEETGAAREEIRRTRVIDWLQSHPRPFAVFTHTDIQAGAICNTCLSAGIGVPEEVAILGYGDDIYSCPFAPVELSSVDPNRAAIVREAARLLQRLMDGGSPPDRPVMIPPKVVAARHSTDILAVPHPAVAKALRFIWDNYRLPLSVNEIAAQSGMSRSALGRAFRQHLGRSVNGELVRKRLERCTELLGTTDLTVGEIAAVTGFPSRTHLYRVFRQTFGTSPRQYRKGGNTSGERGA